jgi:hydrogenase-1 operon protein HyaF
LTAVSFGEGEVSPMVAAILNEVIAGLHTLVATGQPTTIDLRRLPLIPHDLQRLRSSLGKGEVAIEVNALGATRIHETALAAVWWVDHSNDLGDHRWSAIEVALVPNLLPVTLAEAGEAADTLQAKLQSWGQSLQ